MAGLVMVHLSIGTETDMHTVKGEELNIRTEMEAEVFLDDIEIFEADQSYELRDDQETEMIAEPEINEEPEVNEESEINENSESDEEFKYHETTEFHGGSETDDFSASQMEIPEFPVHSPTPLLADFNMSVIEDISVVNAGQQVGYEIVLDNTGDVDLESLELRSILDNGQLQGEWLETEGLIVDDTTGTAILSLLETGTERKIVLMAAIPEERQENLEAEFVVKVKNPHQPEWISRSASLITEIVPLKIDFTVKKWADRAIAVPGDTITYQICIRNTGERTLHSVLTTEKFQTAGLKARFLEQEGVILNGAKTEALIAEIKPGEAYGLYAIVTLPEDFEGGDILNEVTVVTRETGESSFHAQAAVEVTKPSPTEIPQQTEMTKQTVSINDDTIKEIPQTEDISEFELWAGAFGISCLVVISIYWFRKAKRKH